MEAPAPQARQPFALARGLELRRSSQHLDMVRGLAAVAVLLYHVRYRFFLDYSDVGSKDAAAVAWYFVTAFGHDAVMVFFVLSGFLIGSSVLRSRLAGTWRGAEYLTSRSVRLYAVLVPGLLLTLAWDQAGMRWFGDSAIYSGQPQAYLHDYFPVSDRSGMLGLLGNLFYVQTILVPPFGSNDALWSLAFEFWYYAIFPLGLLCVLPRQSVSARLAGFTGAAALCYLVGGTITSYFLIWLLGAAVALLPPIAPIARWPRLFRLIAVPQFLAVLALSHVSAVREALGGSLLAADSLIAVSFAACLYVLLQDSRVPTRGLYGGTAAVLSGCSFTLYVVHLPVLVFIRAWINPGRPWEPDATTIVAGVAIASCVLAYAYVVARATEAHTPALRAAAFRLLRLRPARQPAWQPREAAGSVGRPV